MHNREVDRTDKIPAFVLLIIYWERQAKRRFTNQQDNFRQTIRAINEIKAIKWDNVIEKD